MTFAYYGAADALQGLTLMHEKGQKLTKNWLKKLEGIIFHEFYIKSHWLCRISRGPCNHCRK